MLFILNASTLKKYTSRKGYMWSLKLISQGNINQRIDFKFWPTLLRPHAKNNFKNGKNSVSLISYGKRNTEFKSGWA